MRAGLALAGALLLAAPAGAYRHSALLGHSVEGRPIHAVELGEPHLNPDGYAAGTRQNADGVDLNRNFPWACRPLPGIHDSGPRPLSEPESRLAHRLILRLRPRISILFHQHERVIDESGGDIAVERRFSQLVSLPLRRLPRYPGSAVGWENHRLPGTTAFVVELPAGALSATTVSRYAAAGRNYVVPGRLRLYWCGPWRGALGGVVAAHRPVDVGPIGQNR